MKIKYFFISFFPLNFNLIHLMNYKRLIRLTFTCPYSFLNNFAYLIQFSFNVVINFIYSQFSLDVVLLISISFNII